MTILHRYLITLPPAELAHGMLFIRWLASDEPTEATFPRTRISWDAANRIESTIWALVRERYD